MVNFWQSFGIWVGALCTLAIWSFLYKDNPFYKIAEQIFVGVSAAYWFIYTIYNIMIPNLFTKIIITKIIEVEVESGVIENVTQHSLNWLVIIPGLLGVMMLLRLFPKLDWLSKYPLALMIGYGAGLSIIQYLKSDVIEQISSTMLNPFSSGSVTIAIGQILLIIGTISGLFYFYFSKKHEGFTGGVAKIGIIFLMISFGAAFGYTAMARISLLIGRLQFLLGDWLGVIK